MGRLRRLIVADGVDSSAAAQVPDRQSSPRWNRCEKQTKACELHEATQRASVCQN